eukprot:365592-Chlamydomonas_euryale.AAC.3
MDAALLDGSPMPAMDTARVLPARLLLLPPGVWMPGVLANDRTPLAFVDLRIALLGALPGGCLDVAAFLSPAHTLERAHLRSSAA